jgi:glyoxylase I family protein
LEKVLGIGGLFFRAKDTAALSKWYADNLGIPLVPEDYNTPPWRQAGGSTVFAAFAKDTDYFDRPEQQWMINFRDLDAMTAQLETAGIKVTFEADEPNGRFARLIDPEGNPIQL